MMLSVGIMMVVVLLVVVMVVEDIICRRRRRLVPRRGGLNDPARAGPAHGATPRTLMALRNGPSCPQIFRLKVNRLKRFITDVHRSMISSSFLSSVLSSFLSSASFFFIAARPPLQPEPAQP